MASIWRKEWPNWSPYKVKTAQFSEKNGEKTAVSASVRSIQLQKELKELHAIADANRASDVEPDQKLREKISELEAALKGLEAA